jgi:hypothetical protein
MRGPAPPTAQVRTSPILREPRHRTAGGAAMHVRMLPAFMPGTGANAP